MNPRDREPIVQVGLLDSVERVNVHLEGEFSDQENKPFHAGDHLFTCRDAGLRLRPKDGPADRFSLEATIGIDFHWQQRERQSFTGDLRLMATKGDKLIVINEVGLEAYILSVICSEMSASSPLELAKAHAIISRSWLLSQIENRNSPIPAAPESPDPNEILRYYDREAHVHYDVCADDHCQRYQGTERIRSGSARDAVMATRGQVLTFAGKVCDARFSKCCGGVSEDFRLAWADTPVPYLVPVFDGPGGLPDPPLTDERAFRDYLDQPPDVFCNCTDAAVLGLVLNEYDQNTRDFFRWKVRLDAEEGGRLASEKLGIHLGRLLALEPVERGLSGRLKRLRLIGQDGWVVIGKELEIRRALSPSHLYSSAFIVETEGPTRQPEAFLLHGAGWGHGVGLCQIGAAVMAVRGFSCADILHHYYPATTIEQRYL